MTSALYHKWVGQVSRMANSCTCPVLFDVFVTVDRNLAFQQDIPKFQISVFLLHAPSNRLADLKRLIPTLISALPRATKGEVMHLS